MKVYVVERRANLSKEDNPDSHTIYRQGYLSLEDAKAYVESMEDSPQAIIPEMYQSKDGKAYYYIHEIFCPDVSFIE